MRPNSAAGTSVRLRRNAYEAMTEAMKTPTTLFQTFLKQYQPGKPKTTSGEIPKEEEEQSTNDSNNDNDNENPSTITDDML
jgi:hypothetical protein